MESDTEHNVLSTSGTLAPEKTKTVTEIEFLVPEGASELTICFDYQPRESTDPEVNHELVERAFETFSSTFRKRMGHAWAEGLRTRLGIERMSERLQNLLNVVLIDPNGNWRGRWDRNPASSDGKLRLGLEEASPGFTAGPLPAGTWRAAIECHGIFAKPVSFSLQVGVHQSEASIEQTPKADASQPRASQPNGNRQWYVGEMHSHSTESDGNWSIETLCQNVRADGAQFLFLTDHNTMSGHQSPPEVALNLIPGCELTTFFGHYPTYGIEAAPVWHKDGVVRPIDDISREVRAQGGMIGAAHPFVPGDPLCTGCRMRADLNPDSIDTMEIWYRRWDSPGVDNEAAYALWNAYWRDGHRITGVGARDVHRDQQLHPFPGQMPLTAIAADANSPDAVLAGLKQGRVLVTGGPMLDFALRGESHEARLGETLSEAPSSVRVNLWNTEPDLELRVFRCGELVASTSASDGEHSIELPEPAKSSGWFRLELRDKQGLPRVISNHIVAEAP